MRPRTACPQPTTSTKRRAPSYRVVVRERGDMLKSSVVGEQKCSSRCIDVEWLRFSRIRKRQTGPTISSNNRSRDLQLLLVRARRAGRGVTWAGVVTLAAPGTRKSECASMPRDLLRTWRETCSTSKNSRCFLVPPHRAWDRHQGLSLIHI